MALLTSCWFIIESVIIPDGYVKWFYLSFYIHPFFLIFCQLFLWLNLLSTWILFVIFYPVRIICLVSLCVFKFFRDCVVYIFSFRRVASAEVITEDAEKSLVLRNCNLQNEIGTPYSFSSIAPATSKLIVFEFQNNKLVEDIEFVEFDVLSEEEEINTKEPSSSPDKEAGMNDYISSNICHSMSLREDVGDIDEELDSSSSVYSSNSPASDGENLDMNIEYYPRSEVLCISNSSPVVEREEIHGDDDKQQEISDAFYKKYTERMRWFDLLNYDRTCGISAVLNKQLGTPSLYKSNDQSVEMSTTPYISWSKQTKKRLLRSLESDFEMVYVAQSCLSWEALHYQYTKVKTLAESSSQTGVFYGNVFGDFQKFHVLLERFLEDERCEGKRIWNYVRRRFALNSLLQVPQISGFSEEEKEEVNGEAISVKDVLNVIEKCIEAFGIFVRTDNKRLAWWQLINSLWTYPPVEDPRDLELLRYLTRQLHKKEIWLKDLQGKQRCLFKRVVNPVEESQREEILFTMIDMKLVSRVIQMSIVSSSQLKWCQEMLDNIEFKEGKVFRASTAPLFPP